MFFFCQMKNMIVSLYAHKLFYFSLQYSRYIHFYPCFTAEFSSSFFFASILSVKFISIFTVSLKWNSLRMCHLFFSIFQRTNNFYNIFQLYDEKSCLFSALLLISFFFIIIIAFGQTQEKNEKRKFNLIFTFGCDLSHVA